MSSGEAANNLLPLLGQLQFMEDTLTNLMLETVLKLQTLTDVRVFMLLEYPQKQKRRYCGSKETVSSFEKEGLNLRVESDFAVELNSGASTLVDRRPTNAHFRRVAEPSGVPSPGTLAIRHSDAERPPPTSLREDAISTFPSSSTATNPFAPSPFQPTMEATWDVKAFARDDYEVGPSPSKRLKSTDAGGLSITASGDASKTRDAKVKTEIKDLIPEYVISDDDDDEIDESMNSFVLPIVDFNDFQHHSATYGGGGGGAGDEGSNERTMNDRQLFPTQRQTFSHDGTAGGSSDVDASSFFDALADPHLEREKLITLVNRGDPLAAYEKGTTENKIMKSVCYSVGKNAALKCPYGFTPENKDALLTYWSHHCDLFTGYCAKAGLLVDKNSINVEKTDCLKRMSAVGYIRQSIRDGFKKIAAKHKKFHLDTKGEKMSSADGLISLINQLQQMETAITDFMIETILRLQTLTEARVFLLVEGSGADRKRRYCGAPELVEMYEGSGLIMDAVADTAVELDTTSGVTLINRPSRKRASVSSASQYSSQYSIMGPSTSKKKKSTSSLDADDAGGYPAYVVKGEASDCVVIEDGDDGDDDDDDDAGLHDASDGFLDYSVTDDDSSVYGAPNDFGQLSRDESTSVSSHSGFFDSLPAPEVEEQKLATILRTDNPWAAYDRRRVEYKLWMSVMYGVGKNIALTCPSADASKKDDADVKVYFDRKCEEFMEFCAPLMVLKEYRPQIPRPEHDCLKSLTVAGFIRHSIRQGYKQGCKLLRR